MRRASALVGYLRSAVLSVGLPCCPKTALAATVPPPSWVLGVGCGTALCTSVGRSARSSGHLQLHLVLACLVLQPSGCKVRVCDGEGYSRMPAAKL